MNPGFLLLLALGIFIAYVNGANDVSKGIATLVGSGITNYRRAILWGAVWTGVGGLAGALLAGAMINTFGKGLLTGGTVPTLPAAVATIIGAAAWVAIATRTGLPVSTTHAIVGSIAGVATIAYGLDGFNWYALGSKVALPLLLSPVAAIAVTVVTLKVWTVLSGGSGRQKADCFCVVMEPPKLLATADSVCCGTKAVSSISTGIVVAPESECLDAESGALRLTSNHLHWLTSGGTSFARGMNDAPKMVALILAVGVPLGTGVSMRPAAFILVALGMVAGSWLAGRRVTTVLAEKVTRMDHYEGFVANLVTAAMVGPGAALGLPMSTTHVSTGAIIGLGSQDRGRLQWDKVGEMLLAWVITLPLAAALGIAVFGILRLISWI
jgi:inorganic phosphate transporter, PiT family